MDRHRRPAPREQEWPEPVRRAPEQLGQAPQAPSRSLVLREQPERTDRRSPEPGRALESAERRPEPEPGRARQALLEQPVQTDRHWPGPARVCPEPVWSARGLPALGRKDHPTAEQARVWAELLEQLVGERAAPALSVPAESGAAEPAREQAPALAARVPLSVRRALELWESIPAQRGRPGPREPGPSLGRNASHRRNSLVQRNNRRAPAVCGRQTQCPRSTRPPRPRPGQSG
jgi:hypothetical protein